MHLIENGELRMENVIEAKSFAFAVKIVELTRRMENKREYALTNQLLRSGTSIGANVSEAQQAQSKKDFISKMSIALKEANETKYWLRLMREVENLSETESKEFLNMIDELMRILIAILKSSKEE